jgi:Ca-activated chloride channel family protein
MPLFTAAFALFSAAFLDFHTLMQSPIALNEATVVPREGVAIYFVLDQSGSMREEVPVSSSLDPKRSLPKVDIMKRVTSRFILGDPGVGNPGLNGDLIGVVSFARGTRVLAPLTLDHQTVLDDINAIVPMDSAETDGTAIGYAIYKTASMIAATRHYAQEMIASGQAPYQIKGAAIVVVTDGLQAPSPLDKGKRLRNMDIPEAAAYAKEQHIRLYIINIDPGITNEEFAPFRHIMERSTELTGGKFMIVSGTTPLTTIYDEIFKIEKGKILQGGKHANDVTHLSRAFSLYPYLVSLGLLCIALGVILETLLLRKVP